VISKFSQLLQSVNVLIVLKQDKSLKTWQSKINNMSSPKSWFLVCGKTSYDCRLITVFHEASRSEAGISFAFPLLCEASSMVKDCV